MKELLDEEAFDPKKLFDKEEFVTLLVNRDGFTTKQNDIADLLEEVVDSGITRERKDEILKALKEKNASEILINEINAATNENQKIKLVSVCWESGIDFSKQFLFFVELVFDKNFLLAFEAFTVIENLETVIDKKLLEESLKLIEKNRNLENKLIESLEILVKQMLA